MSLPNEDMSFTPFDQLPASDLNDLVENIEALSDGSGLADGAVKADKLAVNAVTGNDGWISTSDTWTYASASTFTVSGDQTTKYSKGTRLMWTQTTVKYGVVVASSYSAPNTTVTIAVNTDYTIANAAITANFYSYAANPQGYPDWFAYTPTMTAFTASSAYGRFSITGKSVTVSAKITSSTTVSNVIAASLPTQVANSNTNYYGIAYANDVGSAYQTGICQAATGSTSVQFFGPQSASLHWGQSIPFTWGNTDTLNFTITYEMI